MAWSVWLLFQLIYIAKNKQIVGMKVDQVHPQTNQKVKRMRIFDHSKIAHICCGVHCINTSYPYVCFCSKSPYKFKGVILFFLHVVLPTLSSMYIVVFGAIDPLLCCSIHSKLPLNPGHILFFTHETISYSNCVYHTTDSYEHVQCVMSACTGLYK